MNVTCPLCHMPITLNDGLAGKVVACSQCGGNIQVPNLAVTSHYVPIPREQVSVVAAGFLNWLWQGAGYFVIGQSAKGILFCCITLCLLVLHVVTCGLSLILHLPYTIICIIDAVLVAQRINRGEKVGEWAFF